MIKSLINSIKSGLLANPKAFGLAVLALFLGCMASEAQTPIVTNFADGTWGDIVAQRPESGSYGSFDANGFTVRNGVLDAGTSKCNDGTKHVNRIALDKNSARSYFMLPVTENIGILEVHISTGSADRSFIVQEKLGRKWETIGTYNTVKRDSIYTIPLYRATTQLRIANNTGSTLFLWQVKTTVVSDDVIVAHELKRPVVTNFADGSWGRPTSRKPESGAFPSFEANDYSVNCGVLSSGTAKCAGDEAIIHKGRIYLDKNSTGSYLELPEIDLVGDVEIHAATGSDDRSFIVQELDGKHWKTVATFGTTKKEQVYTYSAYKESAKYRIANNSGSALSIYHVKVTRTTAEDIARREKLQGLVTNFGDGTWGEAVKSRPESGKYPTFDVNGFWVYAGVLNKTSQKCVAGGQHINRIVLDKDQEMARIDLPELSDVGELEIHASTGSDGKSFQVLERVGRKWELLGTYTTTKKEQVYVVPVHKEMARLRIRNNTSSSLNIYQIKMRTQTALNSLMLEASSPAQDELCYGNLTRRILLQFNKPMLKGHEALLLNGVAIDDTKVKVKGNIATVRVKLSAGKSHKNYSLTIPQGAFLTEDSISNEPTVMSFDVHKTVSLPKGYAAELDAIYSNANIVQNRVDVYYPKETTKPVPVLINIHGGWSHGEKESQTGYDFYFKNGFAVANIEYRMTTQSGAPAAVVDVRSVINYLAANAERLNIDPHKIVLRGGSSGAYLALTAAYLGQNSPFDAGMFVGQDFTIAAVLDNYGPADLIEFKDNGSLQEWLDDKVNDDEFIKTISPLHLINATTPPTYIIHGDADPTVDYSQSLNLEKALNDAGVKCLLRTVAGGKHGKFSKEQKALMESDIKQFLSEIGVLKTE